MSSLSDVHVFMKTESNQQTLNGSFTCIQYLDLFESVADVF